MCQKMVWCKTRSFPTTNVNVDDTDEVNEAIFMTGNLSERINNLRQYPKINKEM